jgi:ribose/xylose/arabinose/galactoside ABC-type transport system permease subunit
MSTPNPPTAALVRPPSTSLRIVQLLGPFIGLGLVILLFTLFGPPEFLSWYNAKNVATQTVIVGLSALGMTFVIASGGIDLSVGSVMALSSVVTAKLALAGAPPLVAALGGILTGGLVGLVNATVIVTLGIVPFIVTLGTMGMARGFAKLLAHEAKVDAPASWLADLLSKDASAHLLGLPPGLWMFALFALFMAAVLRATAFGVHTLAIGSSEPTARLCGVPVKRNKIWIYTLNGLFAGLSGVMVFARLTVGDPTVSVGLELNVIAAVVIGGASLAGGEGTILGSVIGAFMMSTLANGCDLAEIPNYVQEIIVGVIIIVAVAVDRLRHWRRG